MTVAELCRRHRRIGIDTNVLVYLLEDIGVRADVSAAILEALDARRVSGVLASIGLAELAAGPAQSGDGALIERYADELRSVARLRVVPLSDDIALDAAVIRGARGIGLPDAIHLATARAAGATAFVTNDRSLRGSTKLEVVYLDDLQVA